MDNDRMNQNWIYSNRPSTENIFVDLDHRFGVSVSQFQLWALFVSCSAAHPLHTGLIRLSNAAPSSVAVRSYWRFAGRVIHINQGRQWLTCLVSVRMCKDCDVFSFQLLCTDPCNMEPHIIMLQHEWMVVEEWHYGPQDLIMVYSICGFKLTSMWSTCVSCLELIPGYTLTPSSPWGALFTTLTLANSSPRKRHTCCQPAARCSVNQDSSMKRTLLQREWIILAKEKCSTMCFFVVFFLLYKFVVKIRLIIIVCAWRKY